MKGRCNSILAPLFLLCPIESYRTVTSNRGALLQRPARAGRQYSQIAV